MSKVLVTGSSGYIGMHLCPYLAGKGHHVTGVDKIEGGTGCHEFVHQDITTMGFVVGLNDTKFDTVIHLAALVKVGESRERMVDYYRTNTFATLEILSKVEFDNFIFASTCQATKQHVYGATKLMAEEIVRDYCYIHGMGHTIFRFGNVAGSAGYNPTNIDGLLYNLIQAKETGVFYLYGDDFNTQDGSAMRDYVHVLDICYAIEKAVSRPGSVPGAEFQSAYEYLGTGKQYSVKDCIQAFKEVNNCDFEVKVMPRRLGDPARVGNYEISPYMTRWPLSLREMMKV